MFLNDNYSYTLKIVKNSKNLNNQLKHVIILFKQT